MSRSVSYICKCPRRYEVQRRTGSLFCSFSTNKQISSCNCVSLCLEQEKVTCHYSHLFVCLWFCTPFTRSPFSSRASVLMHFFSHVSVDDVDSHSYRTRQDCSAGYPARGTHPLRRRAADERCQSRSQAGSLASVQS